MVTTTGSPTKRRRRYRLMLVLAFALGIVSVLGWQAHDRDSAVRGFVRRHHWLKASARAVRDAVAPVPPAPYEGHTDDRSALRTTGKPTLLIGYDVEGDAATTKRFLGAAQRIHTTHNAPCTLFVTGRALERATADLQSLSRNPLFDIQQHTYSHVRFKPVVESANGITRFLDAEPVERIAEDVRHANRVFERLLGRGCVGLTAPYGYYRGLSDRRDILSVLHDEGIRFCRSYLRNQDDWQPVSFDVQPFTYAAQGFADVLEIPANGWQDCLWRDAHESWRDVEPWVAYVRGCLEEARRRKATYGLLQHDWSSLRGDPELKGTEEIIVHARRMGFRIMTHSQYYEEVMHTSA